MLNQRGHIPTLLLLIGSVVLVGIAWFTFISFDNSLKDTAIQFDNLTREIEIQHGTIEGILPLLIEHSLRNYEGGDFLPYFNMAFQDHAAQASGVQLITGNFFGKIRNQDYLLIAHDEIYTLELREIFVESETELGTIRRTFNMSIRFNESNVLS